MKRFLAIAAVFGAALSASGATYYVSWSTGSDADLGTSTGTAWKRCPGMTGFTGAYVHASGDRFIFRGGVTWPVGAFPFAITAGGASNASRDYYGIDTNWFFGAGPWTRPVFDFENTIVGGGGTSSSGVLFNSASFATVEGIQMKRHRAPLQYGATTLGITGTSSSITITNCDIGDWSTTGTGAGSDAGGGIQNYGSGVSHLVTNCLLHQDNEPNKCGYATKNIYEVAYNTIRNTPNCAFGYSRGHHNHIYSVPNPTDPTSHPNAMATTGPAETYANLIHDLASGVSAIYVTPNWSGGSNIDLVYNNVVYNVGLQAPIQLDTGGADTPSIGLRAYNNTLRGNSGSGYCIRVVARGTTPYGVLDCQNNHLITSGTAIAYNNVGAGNGNVTTVTLVTNLQMTDAAATSAGYTALNDYQPVSLSAPTVRTGTDRSSYFTVDRLGTARPLNLWDISAYQFAAGGITNPPPPLPRAPNTPLGVSPSAGEMNVSLRPTLAATAFSDPQGSTQIASQWLVLQSGSIVRDSGIYIASTTYPMPVVLGNFTAYEWQARYQNAFGLWSDYSPLVAFTTTNIVIIPPDPPSTNPPPNPPPPSGVRLRAVTVNVGMIRAK